MYFVDAPSVVVRIQHVAEYTVHLDLQPERLSDDAERRRGDVGRSDRVRHVGLGDLVSVIRGAAVGPRLEYPILVVSILLRRNGTNAVYAVPAPIQYRSRGHGRAISQYLQAIGNGRDIDVTRHLELWVDRDGAVHRDRVYRTRDRLIGAALPSDEDVSGIGSGDEGDGRSGREIEIDRAVDRRAVGENGSRRGAVSRIGTVEEDD